MSPAEYSPTSTQSIGSRLREGAESPTTLNGEPVSNRLGKRVFSWRQDFKKKYMEWSNHVSSYMGNTTPVHNWVLKTVTSINASFHDNPFNI